jgi:hypothetical protein
MGWYGKIGCSMTMTESQEFPAPPRLIPAMVAGFDAIANHVLLISFPILLDLLIWLAPHFRLKALIENFLAGLPLLVGDEATEFSSMVETGKEVWMQFAEQVNLMVALRSYPVGIPSLMSATLPLETPFGAPKMLDMPSFGVAAIIFVSLITIGLVIGSFFYLLVSQAALYEEIRWRIIFSEWPRVSIQVILLALIWVGLFFVVSIPASCLISVTTLIGFSLGQLSILFYGGLLIWLIFPLLFSAHGIFVDGLNAIASIRAGIRMTNATLSATVLFVVSAFVLTQGLNLLWSIPPADSWLTLVGIAGHAFVVTGLLSASFVYYKDANRWINRVDQQIQLSVNEDE